MSGGRLAGAIVGGAVIGWLVPSIVLFIVFSMAQAQSDHPYSRDILAIALMIILPSLPTSLLSTTVLGLAWRSIASKRGWRRGSHYALAGLAGGLAVGVLVSLYWLIITGFTAWPLAGIGTLYAMACGGPTGVCAWFILRPDRDVANPTTSAS